MKLLKTLLIGALLIILAIGLLALIPLVILWAINTLGEHSTNSFYIDHNFWTYLATLILTSTVVTSSVAK